MSGRDRDPRVTVLIAAGGTGGHVYPALAVAERLRSDGCVVEWLGTRSGLEARVVPRSGIAIHFVAVSGLRGTSAVRWLAAPFVLAVALAQAMVVILRAAPGVVLGMGGFASGPGGLAAWLLRRPLVIHEQNAIPGLTNRLLARLSARVLEAFPGSFPDEMAPLHTGNPVRGTVLDLPGPEARVVASGAPLRVLVLGGSQGARVLNEVVPAALGGLGPEVRFEVLHQAGPRWADLTGAAYRTVGLDARVTPFIDDMAEAYGWADLVIGRAGAMTVAELAAAGLPSILIPFPHATDDHQTANGRFLADAGAAVLVPESELDRDRIGRVLRELDGARDRLLEMARAARGLAAPDATERVARLCLEVCRG